MRFLWEKAGSYRKPFDLLGVQVRELIKKKGGEVMVSLPKYSTLDTVGQCLRRSAVRYPDKVALISDHPDYSRVTYRKFNELVNKFANSIMKLGLNRGDTVALMAGNSLEFLIIWYGLAKAGITMVPVNLMLKGEELSFIINHSESRIFIMEDTFVDAIKDVRDKLNKVECFMHISHKKRDKSDDSMMDFWSVINQENSTEEPLVEVDSEDIVQLAYTSGTEALPKGVMLTHRGLISQYVSSIVDGDLRQSDVAIAAMPFFHCAQLHCFTGPHIYLGATQVIFRQFEPRKMLETIEREKVSFIFCLPAQYRAMLALSDFDDYDLSSLRMCTYAMAPVSIRELKIFMEKFRPKKGFQIYFGQTEMSPVTTILKPEEHPYKEGSVGKSVLNVELAIMDDNGNFLPPGEVGEIVYRGGHMMKGYFKDEEKTKEAFKFGWFHSGDLGRMDEEGYVWFEDRKKDMIKTGGENVPSIEVEKCIYDYPDVQEVAVFGTPHPVWIEAVTATVVPKPGKKIDPEEIISHCKQRLAGYKVPKKVYIVDELPKTATGKIRKHVLRKQFTSE